MNKDLRKVVFITGGTDGLGFTLAQTLLNKKNSQKYTVAILSRNREKTKSVAKELGCAWAECNVGNWASVEKAINGLVKETGRVDSLVHCAGNYSTGKLEDLSPETLSSVFEVNTLGPMYVTKALLPHMLGKGQIVFVNSIVGFKKTARPSHWIYPLAKEWSMDFCNVISSELAPSGINVSVVYPGAMATQFAEKYTGKSRDLTNALQTSEVAAHIVNIIENPNTRINALTITHLEDYQRV